MGRDMDEWGYTVTGWEVPAKWFDSGATERVTG